MNRGGGGRGVGGADETKNNGDGEDDEQVRDIDPNVEDEEAAHADAAISGVEAQEQNEEQEQRTFTERYHKKGRGPQRCNKCGLLRRDHKCKVTQGRSNNPEAKRFQDQAREINRSTYALQQSRRNDNDIGRSFNGRSIHGSEVQADNSFLSLGQPSNGTSCVFIADESVTIVNSSSNCKNGGSRRRGSNGGRRRGGGRVSSGGPGRGGGGRGRGRRNRCGKCGMPKKGMVCNCMVIDENDHSTMNEDDGREIRDLFLDETEKNGDDEEEASEEEEEDGMDVALDDEDPMNSKFRKKHDDDDHENNGGGSGGGDSEGFFRVSGGHGWSGPVVAV